MVKILMTFFLILMANIVIAYSDSELESRLLSESKYIIYILVDGC